MKNLLFALTLTFTSLSHAQFHVPEDDGVLIQSKEVTLPVDIGNTKIKFTNLGYGSISFVKVIVPELAEHTLLNHRNQGEDGPCLVTYGTIEVDDVVQGQSEVIDTKFSIVLKKKSQIVNNVCKTHLIEYVEADVRGFKFQHKLFHPLPDRVPADCQ